MFATPCNSAGWGGYDPRMSWEALRGDPLPWLLDERRPNLYWRVLTEIVGRPPASPAVVRAQGGANAVEPVAALLEEMSPSGEMNVAAGRWDGGTGTGWRLLAAVQWGADPADPRLQAAASRLLDEAYGEGGFAREEHGAPVPWLSARVLQATAELGFSRHPRFQEALAWLDEGARRAPDGSWLGEDGSGHPVPCAVTAVAMLATFAAGGDDRRRCLRDRAAHSVVELLERGDAELERLGHPCLERTDLAEALWAAARAGVTMRPAMLRPLTRLQARQLEGGRWSRDVAPPAGLPIGRPPVIGEPSRWLTLKAAVAILHYGRAAGLPRMFPEKPEPS